MPVVTRIYWGCTTFNCERGFNGTEEEMPRDWTYCPDCGGKLTKITASYFPPRQPLSEAERIEAQG